MSKDKIRVHFSEEQNPRVFDAYNSGPAKFGADFGPHVKQLAEEAQEFLDALGFTNFAEAAAVCSNDVKGDLQAIKIQLEMLKGQLETSKTSSQVPVKPLQPVVTEPKVNHTSTSDQNDIMGMALSAAKGDS